MDRCFQGKSEVENKELSRIRIRTGTAPLPFRVGSIVTDTEVGRILFPGELQSEEPNTKCAAIIEWLSAAKSQKRDFWRDA